MRTVFDVTKEFKCLVDACDKRGHSTRMLLSRAGASFRIVGIAAAVRELSEERDTFVAPHHLLSNGDICARLSRQRIVASKMKTLVGSKEVFRTRSPYNLPHCCESGMGALAS